ncbi:uncharacterized protein ACIBXB_021251 [Morphnus guianensis]
MAIHHLLVEDGHGGVGLRPHGRFHPYVGPWQGRQGRWQQQRGPGGPWCQRLSAEHGERSPPMPHQCLQSLSGQWDSDRRSRPYYPPENIQDLSWLRRVREEELGSGTMHAASPGSTSERGSRCPRGPSEIKTPGMLRGAMPGFFRAALLIAAELGEWEGYGPGNWGRGMHPQKGKGKGESTGPLLSRSPKGPVPALLKARARKEAEMEVWGRPSSPLLVPHTPVLRRAAILWGGCPGWGRQPWHSRLLKGSCLRCPWDKRPQPGCALYFRSLQGNPELPPFQGLPKSCAVGACPKGCQALAATPLHPLSQTRWLGAPGIGAELLPTPACRLGRPCFPVSGPKRWC